MQSTHKHIWVYALAIVLMFIVASFMADPAFTLRMLTPALAIAAFGLVKSFLDLVSPWRPR